MEDAEIAKLRLRRCEKTRDVLDDLLRRLLLDVNADETALAVVDAMSYVGKEIVRLRGLVEGCP